MRDYCVVVLDSVGGVAKVIGPMLRENAMIMQTAFTNAYVCKLEQP